MKATIALGIFKQLVVILVIYPGLFVLLLLAALELVPVDEVVAGVVRRVYVPTDFDTKRKALSRANAAEKGLK